MSLLNELNTRVDVPLRYLGSEFGLNIKITSKSKILLAFPDVYEIGMSHYGSRLLYDLINNKTEHSAERVYMPWKDAYKIMKKKEIPLKSIETESLFNRFDILGFSLEHELSYTNAMAMIELGGLELFSEDRKTGPLVIAGGSGVFNPSPVIPFFDAFFMGEAEIALPQALDLINDVKDRNERLKILAQIPGFFVPKIHGGFSKQQITVKRQFLDKLDYRAEIENPIVPILDIVHNRLTYEIQRGCDRGCRFCQAGIIYRPVRQRKIEDIINRIDNDLKKTGYRKVGFLSLNAADYQPIKELLIWLDKKYHNKGISISLPSLRIDSFGEDFLKVLSNMSKGGFTIAPETASSRLKGVINKNISNEETIETASKASFYGWKTIKAYFMTGLPTETMDDLHEIRNLAFEMKKAARKSIVTVNVSNFIPKPHTPFQWASQLTGKEYMHRLDFLRNELRIPGVKFKWHDPYLSEIEGVFSRGDQELSKLLLAVYKKGEVFTSWAHEFNYKIWKEEAEKLGIDFSYYLQEREINKDLEWDNIDVGVTKNWLKEEHYKSQKGEETEECLFGKCSVCGVCDSKIKNILAENTITKNDFNIVDTENTVDTGIKKHRYRVRFTKYKGLKWLSHLELMDLVKKIIRRAGIPVNISQGYKPDLILGFSPPTPDAVESFAEFIDIYAYKECNILKLLNKYTVDGLKFIRYAETPVKAPSIQEDINDVLWCARFNKELLRPIFMEEAKKTENFIKEIKLDEKQVLKIIRKKKTKEIFLKDYVKDIRFTLVKDYCFINFKTMYNETRSIKPLEVLQFLANLKKEDIGRDIKMKKLKISGVLK